MTEDRPTAPPPDPPRRFGGFAQFGLAVLVFAMTIAATACSSHEARPHGQPTSYHTTSVDGLPVFYREAGPADGPTILLLHGFPSSSRMFDSLLSSLSDRFHLVAPDLVGFGHSAWPAPQTFAYTFDHLTTVVDHFTERIGVTKYVLYVQDYGADVGMRLAIAHPERLTGLIVQNAALHPDALGPLWDVRRAFWTDRAAHEEQLRANFTSLSATQARHVGDDPDVARYDPDLWTDEYRFLTDPRQGDIQLDLFYDYRTNVAAYPAWDAWLREHRPRTLVLWGKYDPSFLVAEVDALKRDLPDAEVHVVDGGHFALDTAGAEMSRLVRRFAST